jgi:hypothetical protein
MHAKKTNSRGRNGLWLLHAAINSPENAASPAAEEGPSKKPANIHGKVDNAIITGHSGSNGKSGTGNACGTDNFNPGSTTLVMGTKIKRTKKIRSLVLVHG